MMADQRGRFFQHDDSAPGTSPAVVLSDGIWAERFGRSDDAVGRTLTIDSRPYLVVGTAPREFVFPEKETRIWVGIGPMPKPTGDRDQVTGGALARLAPRATAAAAAVEGTQAARSVEVRSALGAPRTTLIGMVVREGMAVMLAGAGAGVAGAAAVTRLMQALLFGVEPIDAWSFTAAVIVLTGVALVACSIPAARAAAVDPAISLRTE